MKTEKKTTILQQGVYSKRLGQGRGGQEKGRGGGEGGGSSNNNNIGGKYNPNRTSFADACSLIMKLLAEEQQPRSISGLSRDAQLHRKTVEKCVELLFELEKNWLDTYRVRLDNLDKRRRIVSLERRTGLLSYPEEAQSFIIRTKHYPLPSKGTYVMTYLYLKDATTSEKATAIPDEEGEHLEKEAETVVRRLLKQGKIFEKIQQEGKEGGGSRLFYLSKEGITIAKGALRVYPELKQQHQQQETKAQPLPS